MKLLVSWMRELGTYVSREFYYTMRDLIETRGWRHSEPCPMPQRPAELRTWMVDRFGGMPSVILFWETYDLFNSISPALRELGCRLVLFADDLHMFWGHEDQRESKVRALGSCHLVLASYAYVFGEFFPELAHQTVRWIPHAASNDFSLRLNHAPENAILLSGFIGSLYPLRWRMRELESEGRFPIVRHAHPGYHERFDHETDARVGAGYAHLIRRYLAAFTDALTFRYVVAKYFEIPATGSLLAADGSVAGPLGELGFEPGVHYVPVTLENLEERLGYILEDANRGEIDEIRRRGQQLALSCHRTCHRARAIDEACADIAAAI
jgi:hypothetical protein